MTERETLVTDQRIQYEGLFSLADLYATMDEYFEDIGYDKREMKNIERVYKDHKFVEIEIEPFKRITDYAASQIRVRFQCHNLKEVEVEKDGVKVKLNKGRVQLVFSAFLQTDYESKWENKAMLFFFRVLFDKFFMGNYTNQYKAEIMNDYKRLVSQVQSYLNLYKMAESNSAKA